MKKSVLFYTVFFICGQVCAESYFEPAFEPVFVMGLPRVVDALVEFDTEPSFMPEGMDRDEWKASPEFFYSRGHFLVRRLLGKMLAVVDVVNHWRQRFELEPGSVIEWVCESLAGAVFNDDERKLLEDFVCECVKDLHNKLESIQRATGKGCEGPASYIYNMMLLEDFQLVASIMQSPTKEFVKNDGFRDKLIASIDVLCQRQAVPRPPLSSYSNDYRDEYDAAFKDLRAAKDRLRDLSF